MFFGLLKKKEVVALAPSPVVPTLKQYVHGRPGSKGSPTVEMTDEGRIIRAVFIPYQLDDGSYRLTFNFAAITDRARPMQIFAIFGIKAKNLFKYDQAVSAMTDGHLAVAHVSAGSNSVVVEDRTRACTQWTVSGDIELEEKPVWME